MKGLTLDQFKEIVEFAQTYHEFGRYYDEIERAGVHLLYPKLKNLSIKYIDSCYDSRDASFWVVTFRNGNPKREFNLNVFNHTKPAASYFDWIMAYLKGEIE